MTAAYALQEAIYAHLTSDTALMNELTGVFDHVPQGVEYPYLHFGEAQTQREQLSMMAVETISLRFVLFSRESSRAELSGILERVFELLHNHVNLNVIGYHLARLQLNEPEVQRGKDGLSYQADITLSAVLTKI